MEKTLFDFYKEMEKHGESPALADKNLDGGYDYISYKELLDKVDLFMRGLGSIGIERGSKTAILAENSTKHVIADLANIMCGGITVPIYTTYSQQKIEEILKDSGAKNVIVSTEKQYSKIKPLEKKLGLEKLIFLEDWGQEFTPKHNYHFGKISGPYSFEKILKSYSFDRVLEIGYSGSDTEFDYRTKKVKPSDTALIMYTSGTTGKPKGVMITHRNITSNVDEMRNLFNLSTKDRTLSILPYGHAFEHTNVLILMVNGSSIAFSKKGYIREMKVVKPTILMAVPSLYEKIIEKINLNLDKSYLKEKVFKTASFLKSRGILEDFLSKTVFKGIYEKLGGSLNHCIVGGGPLNEKTEKFFFEVLGINLYNGYGTSETSPIISVNTKKFHKYGSVGKPLPNLEVRILNGEIIVSGPSVTEKGYYKDEEKTNKVLKEIDGKKFYFTGDKGKIDDEGYLYVLGRMQNDIRLTTGQNLGLAEELEEPLKELRCIEDLMIHGQGERYITAFVVPNFSYLKGLNLENNVDEKLLKLYEKLKDLTPENEVGFDERKVIAANKNVYELILNEINLKNKKMGLEEYAQFKKFVLLPCGFSEADTKREMPELLTPTKKVKRNQVLSYYKQFFDMLYKR